MKIMNLLVAAAAVTISSDAATFYVDASRPDDSGDGLSWSTAKQTIQAAVGRAAEQDLVLVTNGFYNLGFKVAADLDVADDSFEHLLRNRVCIEGAVTVRSVNGPEVTFIEGAADPSHSKGLGADAIRCAYVAAGGVLDGFTLREGYSEKISDFYPDESGGGALLIDRGQLNNCIVRNCTGNWGGGIMVSYNSSLNNCLVIDNFGISDAGGVVAEYGSTLRNCTIINNFSREGSGGAYLDESVLVNSIVYNNESRDYAVDEWNLEAYETIGITYVCSAPLVPGIGNIDSAPLFKAADSGFLVASSPCINAGNNAEIRGTFDLTGLPRILDSVVDLGCNEFYSPSYDSNSDGVPDDWYRGYGFDFVRPDVGRHDPDKDGQDSRSEYIAGLDPTDSNSVFRVSEFKRNPRASLKWEGKKGRRYSVYWATNLVDGFELIESDIPWSDAAYTDEERDAETQGFYRIGVELE